MEWWTQEMTDFVVRLVLALAAVLIGAWKAGGLDALRAWAASQKVPLLGPVALKLIEAADRELSGAAGWQKLEWALDQPLAKRLRIDAKDIEVALAVRDTTMGKVATLTNELTAANARIAALEAQLAALSAPATAVAEAIGFADKIGSLRESFHADRPGGDE